MNTETKQNYAHLTLCEEIVKSEASVIFFFRYLATGNSFRPLAFTFRLGEKTVRTIVYETCTVIWNKMKIATPSKEDWKQIINEFWEQWNFPNCIGALDGKHVVIECPKNSESKYFSCKKTFSIVLLLVLIINFY